jgi:two-component system, chemotaxis family, sensor kinase CheA
MDIGQFKKKFIDEAETLLTKLDNIIIELEKDFQNKELIDEAYRVMHTIKGASGMFGFEKIVETTHNMESIFDLAHHGKLSVTPEIIELSFSVADHIKALLTDEFCENLENQKRDQQIKSSLENIRFKSSGFIEEEIKSTTVVEGSVKISTWNILFYPSEELIKRAINLTYTFQDLFVLGEYQIYNRPIDSGQGQYWSIFLVTEKAYSDIEDALMFIMDNCRITKIADYNIFSKTEFDQRVKFVETLDEVKLPETGASIYKEETKPVKRTIPSPGSSCNEQNDNIQKEIDSGNKAGKVREQVGIGNTIGSNRVNVDAVKLDSLMYLVSELVTSKSELILALEKGQKQKAIDVAWKIEELSKLFSESALSIRLVSLEEMLSRFKRLIRDLSKQLGKEIEFKSECGDTELDKNIIDAIGEPIMHLIRNSIDHGIEIPQKRLERGKPITGNIVFKAQKTGNFVLISISDDGNGIDPDYILKKAVEKGFIPAGANLCEKEIYDLIFLPGFSTAQNLSNISGRGVGMDIVIKKIQEIRGGITVSSEKGRGTTFVIKLQQTISIIETLLVSAGNVKYAIPIENVESCELMARECLKDRQNMHIEYNMEMIPFMNLREKYSTNGALVQNEMEKLVVIKRQDRHYALVVDQIIGEFQAVVKPLGQELMETPFVSGASLLGDGTIAILLNTDKLWYELSIKN